MVEKISPTPIVNERLEQRWALWLARSDEDDRARRKVFAMLAALILSAAVLSGLWAF